jgi:Ca-activated chloride channel family protein
VTYEEFGLMVGGLAAALRAPDIAAAFSAGPAGASLGALLLFSGLGAHEVLVEWTRLSTADDITGFADAVENVPRIVRPGLTAIGEALRAAEDLLRLTPAQPSRRIIDVVGDGRSNDGASPGPIRDRIVASCVTINGLCVLHEEPDLQAYFTAEVIGGPGAFALVCQDYASFAEAIRQKLQRELVA